MAETIDEQIEFISKLLRLSYEGRLEWEPDRQGGFRGRLLGRDLRVYEEDATPPPALALIVRSPHEAYPKKQFVLEVIAPGANFGHKINGLSGLDTLFKAASFRGSRVDEFMKEVLAS